MRVCPLQVGSAILILISHPRSCSRSHLYWKVNINVSDCKSRSQNESLIITNLVVVVVVLNKYVEWDPYFMAILNGRNEIATLNARLYQ